MGAVLLAYLAGWFATLLLLIRLSIKPVRARSVCHAEPREDARYAYQTDHRNRCVDDHRPGCWRPNHDRLEVGEIPDAIAVAVMSAVSLAWPVLALPGLAWLIGTGRARRDVATARRRAALEAELAQLEREAGL